MSERRLGSVGELTLERLRELAEIAEALTWMGNKVTEAFHALGSEDNPKEALDILYAAYRRYHDELKGRVTNCA